MKDHLLKEVDDALKLHRLQQLWQKHGQQIVLGVAAAVIAVIALLVWKQQQHAQNQEQSDLLLAALVASEQGEALPDLSELTGAHAQLAALLKASREPDSAASLQEAREMENGNALLADYACMLATNSQADLRCQPSAALRPLMQEFQLVQLLHKGDVTQAHSLLATLSSEPRDPMAKRRLDDLRAYVNSSLSDHLPTPIPTDATDATPAE